LLTIKYEPKILALKFMASAGYLENLNDIISKRIYQNDNVTLHHHHAYVKIERFC